MREQLKIATFCPSYLISTGLKQLLSNYSGISISEYVGDLRHLAMYCQRQQIDVVFIEIQGRLKDYLAVIQNLRKAKIKIISIAYDLNQPDFISHFDAHLPIEAGPGKSQAILKGIIDPLIKNNSPVYEMNLSEREKEILKKVVKGLTTQEIAEELFLSGHTVVTHRKNISRKLGIKTVSGLTVYALLNNIVSLHEIHDQG